jgi:hypothetical protein
MIYDAVINEFNLDEVLNMGAIRSMPSTGILLMLS